MYVGGGVDGKCCDDVREVGADADDGIGGMGIVSLLFGFCSRC